MSTCCDRFDREALLALEAGEPLDPAFESCDACRRMLQQYEEIGGALATLGSDLEPDPQWQAKTWARIAQRRPARPSWWRRWRVLPALAVMVLAVGVFFLARHMTVPETLAVGELAVVVERGERVMRSDAPRPGDRLQLRGGVGEALHADLRLYRNDRELVFRCDAEAGCRRLDGGIVAEIELDAIGAYQPLLLWGDAPIPTPTGSGLDGDVEEALEARLEVELGDEIVVE
ncbi:MAG: hypothetical protein AAGD38_20075 [Acidobacteriota bacterium]